MDTPNHNEAGMIAFALIDQLFTVLIGKGLLSRDDMPAIIASASAGFRTVPTGNARLCEQWLVQAAKLYPMQK